MIAQTIFRPRLAASPLAVSVRIDLVGSVGTVQQYDAAFAEYYPTWALGGPVLRPVVTVIDPDGQASSDDAPVVVGSVKWTEIQDGTEHLLEAGTKGYRLDYGGGDWPYGQLQVMRDLEPGTQLSLRYEAQYKDPRTGQVYPLMATVLLRCESVSDSMARMMADVPDGILYNPFSSPAELVIRPELWVNAAPLPEADYGVKWGLVWEQGHVDVPGDWYAVDPAELQMCDTVMEQDGRCLRVRQGLMPEGALIRCSGWWKPDDDTTLGYHPVTGAGGVVSYQSAGLVPRKVWSFHRDLGAVKAEIQECPEEFTAAVSSIGARAIVTDGRRGIVENPARHLSLVWRVAKGKADGSQDFSGAIAGTGERLSVDVAEACDPMWGMSVRLDASDRGADCLLGVGGKVLTVGGKLLVVPGAG